MILLPSGSFTSGRLLTVREVSVGVATFVSSTDVFTDPFKFPAFAGVMGAPAVKEAEGIVHPFFKGTDAAARFGDVRGVVLVLTTLPVGNTYTNMHASGLLVA